MVFFTKRGKMKSYCAKISKYFLLGSFISGIAKILDIGNTSSVYIPSVRISSAHIYISNKEPFESDYNAIKSDWLAVGNDLQTAIYHFSKQAQDSEHIHK